MRFRLPQISVAGLVAALVIAGCGSSDDESSRAAPAAAEFPSPKGKTIADLLHDPAATPTNLVVAPAAQVFRVGENRYSFGVFTKGNEQVDDADVALYFAKNGKGPVQGPLPAQVTSLETKPAYRARGADGDATTIYVVPEVDFDSKGQWLGVAMLKGEDGLEVSRLASPVVDKFAQIPDIGEKAPLIHTPTASDVGGDMAKIDTRVPPDQMHQVDFADAVGKKPIVLVIATPALCQTRVCGPIVDVAQQVADVYGEKADFIHMEVYKDNELPKGPRPQLLAYNLESEPWTFLVDRNGVIRDRIEGAFGVSELEEAIGTIVPGR